MMTEERWGFCDMEAFSSDMSCHYVCCSDFHPLNSFLLVTMLCANSIKFGRAIFGLFPFLPGAKYHMLVS